MGNVIPTQNQSCKEKVSEIIDESKIQIERLNPFSKIQEQVPYAEPLEQNIFAGTPEEQRWVSGIIEKERLKKPEKFKDNEGYEYDEKFWKKQNPNAVIRGHWYRRVPHGLSTFYFPGGKRVFVAYFNHGVPIFDQCLVTFQNGAYYHGGLKNFKFHGFGKYVNQSDGVIIQGEWRDGFPAGKVSERLSTDKEVTEFEGEISQEGEKTGKNCSYLIKSKDLSEVLFQYKGDFLNDQFAGDSMIQTQKGKHKFETFFKEEKMEIKSLETQDFQFEGQLSKNFTNGHGKFHDLKFNAKVVYQGDLHNGMLDGPGSIINEDGSVEKVYWFQGLKLKHLRNFEYSNKFKEMIHRIEQAYQRSNTYTEMTKTLADQYKEIQNVQTAEGISPKGHHDSYLFEMISKEKVNTIVGSSKVGQSSPLRHPKKELIVELDKGKFLYVTCFKIHANEKSS